MNKLSKYFFLIPGILVLLTYSKVTNYEFTIDDKIIIAENNVTQKGVSALGEIFTHTSFHGNDEYVKSSAYRPIPSGILAIGVSMFGFDSAGPFHGMSLFFMVVLVTMVFFIVKNILLRENKHNANMALVIASIFAVHSSHTEVIANIKSIDEILCLIFILFGLWFWVKLKNKESIAKLNNKSNILFYALFSVIGILAIMSKETGIILFPLVFVFDFFYKNVSIKDLLKESWKTLPAILVYWLIRSAVIGDFEDTGFGLETNGLYTTANALEWFFTSMYLAVHYAIDFIYPFNELWLYSHGDFNFTDGTMFIGVVVFFFIITVSYLVLSKRIKSKVFGFAWFFNLLVFLVVGNVLFANGTMYAQRFLFIPSLLGVLIIVLIIQKYIPKFTIIFGGIMVLFYGFTSMNNIQAWENNDLLLHQLADNGKGYAALRQRAHFEFEKQDFAKAFELCNQSIDLFDNYQCHSLKGHMYFRQNDYASAAYEYNSIIEKASPQNQDRNYWFCGALSNMIAGNKEQAKIYLKWGLKINPTYQTTGLMGELYMSELKMDSAKYYLELSLRDNLDNPLYKKTTEDNLKIVKQQLGYE